MLSYVLALVVASGSFALYMAAFFFPEVHRKNDFIWSGVGLFYALVLWVCADRITGGVLLGQTAGVVLLGWLGWQTFMLRRQAAPLDQQTPLPTADEVKGALSDLAKPENFSKLSGQAAKQFGSLKNRAQGLVGKQSRSPGSTKTQPNDSYVPLSRADFGPDRRSDTDTLGEVIEEAVKSIPPASRNSGNPTAGAREKAGSAFGAVGDLTKGFSKKKESKPTYVRKQYRKQEEQGKSPAPEAMLVDSGEARIVPAELIDADAMPASARDMVETTVELVSEEPLESLVDNLNTALPETDAVSFVSNDLFESSATEQQTIVDAVSSVGEALFKSSVAAEQPAVEDLFESSVTEPQAVVDTVPSIGEDLFESSVTDEQTAALEDLEFDIPESFTSETEFTDLPGDELLTFDTIGVNSTEMDDTLIPDRADRFDIRDRFADTPNAPEPLQVSSLFSGEPTTADDLNAIDLNEIDLNNIDLNAVNLSQIDNAVARETDIPNIPEVSELFGDEPVPAQFPQLNNPFADSPETPGVFEASNLFADSPETLDSPDAENLFSDESVTDESVTDNEIDLSNLPIGSSATPEIPPVMNLFDQGTGVPENFEVDNPFVDEAVVAAAIANDFVLTDTPTSPEFPEASDLFEGASPEVPEISNTIVEEPATLEFPEVSSLFAEEPATFEAPEVSSLFDEETSGIPEISDAIVEASTAFELPEMASLFEEESPEVPDLGNAFAEEPATFEAPEVSSLFDEETSGIPEISDAIVEASTAFELPEMASLFEEESPEVPDLGNAFAEEPATFEAPEVSSLFDAEALELPDISFDAEASDIANSLVAEPAAIDVPEASNLFDTEISELPDISFDAETSEVFGVDNAIAEEPVAFDLPEVSSLFAEEPATFEVPDVSSLFDAETSEVPDISFDAETSEVSDLGNAFAEEPVTFEVPEANNLFEEAALEAPDISFAAETSEFSDITSAIAEASTAFELPEMASLFEEESPEVPDLGNAFAEEPVTFEVPEVSSLFDEETSGIPDISFDAETSEVPEIGNAFAEEPVTFEVPEVSSLFEEVSVDASSESITPDSSLTDETEIFSTSQVSNLFEPDPVSEAMEAGEDFSEFSSEHPAPSANTDLWEDLEPLEETGDEISLDIPSIGVEETLSFASEASTAATNTDLWEDLGSFEAEADEPSLEIPSFNVEDVPSFNAEPSTAASNTDLWEDLEPLEEPVDGMSLEMPSLNAEAADPPANTDLWEDLEPLEETGLDSSAFITPASIPAANAELWENLSLADDMEPTTPDPFAEDFDLGETIDVTAVESSPAVANLFDETLSLTTDPGNLDAAIMDQPALEVDPPAAQAFSLPVDDFDLSDDLNAAIADLPPLDAPPIELGSLEVPPAADLPDLSDFSLAEEPTTPPVDFSAEDDLFSITEATQASEPDLIKLNPPPFDPTPFEIASLSANLDLPEASLSDEAAVELDSLEFDVPLPVAQDDMGAIAGLDELLQDSTPSSPTFDASDLDNLFIDETATASSFSLNAEPETLTSVDETEETEEIQYIDLNNLDLSSLDDGLFEVNLEETPLEGEAEPRHPTMEPPDITFDMFDDLGDETMPFGAVPPAGQESRRDDDWE